MSQADFVQSTVKWVTGHKLQALAYLWGGGISTCLAYQWTRPIPTSLKIIHSRVYAQAFTLAALGSVAAIEMYSQSKLNREDQS